MKLHLKYSVLLSVFLLGDLLATIINVPEDYPTIQQGINAAIGGDTILVAPGTYVENINYNGKNVVVTSSGTVEETIIDGNEDGSVVTFENGEDSTAVLKGLVITNGSAQFGGGILINAASPTLIDLVIKYNSAVFGGAGITMSLSNAILYNSQIEYNSVVNSFIGGGGGGIYLSASSPTITNVTISNNSATAGLLSATGGGILSLQGSNPVLIDVVISDNYGDLAGGCAFSDSPYLENVTIVNNSCSKTGGGYFAWGESSPTLQNVLIAGNSAGTSGGGMIIYIDSNPMLLNVTIADNSADISGGGIYLYGTGEVSVVNSIIWNNEHQEILFAAEYVNAASEITISYSDLMDGAGGIISNDYGTVNWLEGNIDDDPLFTDPAAGDYSLQEGSPCIDAGTDFFEWEGDTLVNMSPDEYNGNAPDMGAYESDYTGGQVSIVVENQYGWNLVGLPLEVYDPSYQAIYPDALTGTLFSYNTFEGYQNEAELVAGKGYWLRFPSSGSTTISGEAITDTSIYLYGGWNLVSGFSEEVNVNDIIDEDGIIVANTWYGYDNAYFNAQVLIPGYAYWVRAIAEGLIIIPDGGNQ